MVLATIGALPIGLQGLREGAEAKHGAIISDRLELAFKGINKRQFQYTFKMIPRSQRRSRRDKKNYFYLNKICYQSLSVGIDKVED